MLQIISCKRKNGEFQGRAYDNVVLYCADYDSTNRALVFGPEIKEAKIKFENFGVILGRNIGALNDKSIKDVKDIEGLGIVLVYNEFGNVVDFTLHKAMA